MKTLLTLLALTWFLLCASPAHAWWNSDWTMRKKITIDATDTGVPLKDPIGTTAVLVRLHDGTFQFGAAKEDGSDIRFVAADDKTMLKHHVERFDALLYEAFVWVQVPEVKPGAQTEFWLYYGNTGANAERADDPKGTYDADTVLVYHFSENNAPPADSSPAGINAETSGASVNGALIGGGLLMTGQSPVTIPAAPQLAWTAGGSITWSAWIKPTTLASNAVIFSRREEERAFVVGVDNGVPFVEIITAAGSQRSATGAPLALNAWRHLAVVIDGAQTTLLLDGEPYSTLATGLPALNSSSSIGKDTAPDAAPGFVGELDELQIAKTARPAGLLKLAAISQSTSGNAGKLLAISDDETGHGGGENELVKHISLITDISKSLTVDGWVVIVLCLILALVGWWITVVKFIYLNKIKKATDAFLGQWKKLSTDLTVLDHGDAASIRSMGGMAGAKVQRVMGDSPLYHIYQIGSEEIQNRLASAKENFTGLSGRSMQAIRATLDGGLIRETQRLNGNLVFLTIGIAGGPYLGLLGTVIGVMITFAVIAKSGEVEVNSIAPGIAGALLATVAGLAVAIPALFAYSYISSRIKDAVSEMHIFIDEFVAKIAEFYSSPKE